VTEGQVTDEDIESPVRRLYPWIHPFDDGTWLWMLNDTTAQGYGIMPWISTPLTLAELNYIDQGGNIPAVSNEHLVPSFAHWKSTSFGLYVEITDWWCYDRTPSYGEDHDMWESRSHIINLIPHNDMNWNPYAWYAPVWAVTPIDTHYARVWLDEAAETWDHDAMRDTYDEAAKWYCCSTGSEEAHWDGSCACRQGHGPDSCGVYEFEHTCGKQPTQPVDDTCLGNCDYGDMDYDKCDCGLNEYEVKLLNVVEQTSDCLNSIATYSDIFVDTWRYALESYYRGWTACYEAHQNQKGPSWFSSLWFQRSPFSQRPGPAPLVQGQLPLSTGSATRQVC
jgi:hypothetical protein